MRSRRVIVPVIGLLGLLAPLAAPATPAAAAAKPSNTVPGLLRPQDLPSGLQPVAPATALTTFSTSIVDPTKCTETPQPITAVTTVVGQQYAPVGAAPGAIALAEGAVTFAETRAAKAAYALIVKSAGDAVTCSSVGLVPQGATAPIVTFAFARVAFPKIGAGSYANSLSLTSTTGIPSTQVVFLSGANIVFLSAIGASAPSLTDLKKIAARANQRLAVRMPTPTTTSTTTPKPLTVDPVASHCADEGKVVSPSSSQQATITFANQTGQPLKIYWLDYTGARKPYGEVAPGATINQSSFSGHYWLLADSTDRCVRVASIDGPTFTMAVSG